MSILARQFDSGRQQDTFYKIDEYLVDIFKYVGQSASKSGVESVKLLITGSTALYMHGFRDEHRDIDILVQEDRLLNVLPSSMIEAGINKKEVEFCFHNKLSGLYDQKMFRRGGPFRTCHAYGVEITCQVYPEEYQLLFLMEYGKEKSLGDIQRMLMTIPSDRIIHAFNDLAKSNEDWVMGDIADMLMTDYAMLIHTGSSTRSVVHDMQRIIDNIRITEDKKDDLKGILSMVAFDPPREKSAKIRTVRQMASFDR